MNARNRFVPLLGLALAVALFATVACAASARSAVSSSPASLRLAPLVTRGVDLNHLSIGLSQVATGFSYPLYVTGAGDGSGRLFVVEQTGKIRVVRGGVVQPGAYLDLSSVIHPPASPGDERGLLGLAFSPGYATDGRLYVDYTDVNGNTVVARYIAGDPATDTPTFTHQDVLHVAQPYANHNGGCLQFGPDRMLYIGMGDGGSGGDPGNRAQWKGTLLGKMLRIDTGDAVTPATFTGTYTIPASNPFYSKAGWRKEIWAYGVRNPWRFSFDVPDGKLWIGDVGQDKYEEIDMVSASKGGQNYGWHVWEGNHRYTKKPKSVSKVGYTFPILEYPHPYGEAVTGGYVYRGSAYPALVGTYLYADFEKGWISGIKRYSTTGALLKTPQKAKLLQSNGMFASFGTDDASELYVCDWLHGRILQVTATTK